MSEFHAGSYTCIASSVAGSDEQTYVLRVVTPPRLEDPSAPTFVSVRASRPATLSCLIHASPDPQIFWFKVTEDRFYEWEMSNWMDEWVIALVGELRGELLMVG